ncbi:MAG: DNA-binding protein [Fibrobacteres bacterium]|nr:DNA-binding protein [Fibrobacterota bacterium]
MSRAQRLLEILELLRRNRFPITGAALSRQLGISLRSLYRDIATLQSQGARIDGAPGMGYVLKPGFTLPPMMFSEEEIEALVLGARWVADKTDEKLAEAARNALARISAVLPPALRDELESSTLLIGPGDREPVNGKDIADLRDAIRRGRKIAITYRDAKDEPSSRIVWPFALAFFDSVRMVVAWCELRDGFRNFRADRIAGLEVLDTGYPRSRHALLAEWRALEGIPPP